jgi:Ca-activated chloride channel family protein
MTFLWGRLLWLLFLIPALVVAYLIAQRRRQKYALRFASLSVVKEALGKGPGIRRHIPPILFLTAMAVLIVALGRPTATVILPSQRATVILTMDVSGSMRADDVAPSRIEAAQAAARAFVMRQPANQRIGVVTFSESAAVAQAPTTEREAVLAAIGRLRTNRGTAIGRGILTSMDTILEEYGKPPLSPPSDLGFGAQRGFGSRGQGNGQQRGQGNALQGGGAQSDPGVDFQGGQGFGSRQSFDLSTIPLAEPGETYPSAIIVLLSDGQSNTGPDPIEVVNRIADRGVKIYTIGLGTPEGTVLHVFNRAMRVRLDEDTLKRIAENTNGTYFRAESDTDLRAIYENLGTRLVLETKKTEITAVFVALASALLMVAGAFSLAWFNRLP